MARQLNGSTDKLSAAGVPVAAPALTIATWFRADGVSGNQAIMYLGNGSTLEGWAALYLNNDVLRAYWNSNSDNSQFADAPGSASAATWHHGAAVFSSANSRFAALDGSVGTTNATSSGAATLNRTSLGLLDRSSAIWRFAGRLAHAAVWSSALGSTALAALAGGANPLAVEPGSLVGYWPLAGSDSPEPDAVGSLPLTLTGTAFAADPPGIDPPPGGASLVPLIVHHMQMQWMA